MSEREKEGVLGAAQRAVTPCVTDEMVTAAMRAFERMSSVLRYREKDKWHSCDIMGMRDALRAALSLVSSTHQPASAPHADVREALKRLVNCEALSGVRALVGGWNGEGRDEPYKHRHPSKLGATLPKTNCGAVYELDEALEHARAALSRPQEGAEVAGTERGTP